jgi:hypothetical protein
MGSWWSYALDRQASAAALNLQQPTKKGQSMDPTDRVAAIFYLILLPAMMYVAGSLAYRAWMKRPLVTKDPHTGVLYIPRSDLTITGEYTRRHG